MNSKWKYLRRLLKEKKDISLDKGSSVPYISMPRPRYRFKILVHGSEGVGKKPGDGNEGSIGRKELYKYFIGDTNIPIIDNYKEPEFITKKEGKTNKGRMSQLDIRRTLEQKMKRLIISNSDISVEDMFDEPFIDSDLVFNRYATKEYYIRKAIVVLGVDVSGSISPIERIIGKSLVVGLLDFFGKNFSESTFYCFTHQANITKFDKVKLEKREDPLNILDEKEGEPLINFSKFEGGGGTSLVDTIEYLIEIKENNPQTPIYFFYSGDFEVFNDELIQFKKEVVEKGLFDYNGFLIYSGEETANLIGNVKNKYSKLVLGNRIRYKNDPADVISWVFKNLGKQGTFIYDET